MTPKYFQVLVRDFLSCPHFFWYVTLQRS